MTSLGFTTSTFLTKCERVRVAQVLTSSDTKSLYDSLRRLLARWSVGPTRPHLVKRLG
ncbi:hypothetical protein Hanom_Chr12g01094311 [Helianthus anomalus]